MKTFRHSGDIGDLIYGLPVVRALGGGQLCLTPSGYTRVKMDAARAESIATLVTAQPYITECVFKEERNAIDLDRWREFENQGLNIAEMHLKAFSLSPVHCHAAWIRAPQPTPSYPVVVNRSIRYQNPSFPWPRILAEYKGRIGFVGTVQEHRPFSKMFGPIEHLDTPTLLDLANVIAGAELFVGNQSAPLAIAEAMKKKIVQECSPRIPNCMFKRPGTINVRDGSLELPEMLT